MASWSFVPPTHQGMIMKRDRVFFRGLVFFFVAGLTVGCSRSKDVVEKKATAPGGEVVNAGTPDDDPAHPLLTRFWMEVDPTKGHVTAYEIHPGNRIYRDKGIDVTRSGLRYEYGDGSPP